MEFRVSKSIIRPNRSHGDLCAIQLLVLPDAGYPESASEVLAPHEGSEVAYPVNLSGESVIPCSLKIPEVHTTQRRRFLASQHRLQVLRQSQPHASNQVQEVQIHVSHFEAHLLQIPRIPSIGCGFLFV